MEEALWAVQQAMLEALLELPRTQREVVEAVYVRMQETVYWQQLEEARPSPPHLFYMLFIALVKEGSIEVRRARRGEAIEYGVTHEIAQNLEAWANVDKL